ncbi:MAG: EpsG family protein [Muribaculaceae bacterium]|nr:EpsG family protein [Muribaculaceae bacterium]
MGYFYIILFMFVALSYCYDYKKLTLMRGFWLIIMWLVVVCIAGFRYRLGVDSVWYEHEYPEMPTLAGLADYKFEDSRYQVLYIVFTAICRSISSDFTAFQILHAVYVNAIIFWFFNKYTKHTFTALSLYFLMLYIPFNMEVVRESLAVSTFLLAWPMFKQGKWVWYYAICLVAFGFHMAAMLTFFIPIFWLPWLRQFFVLGKRTIIICALLFAVGFTIQNQFFDILNAMSMSDNFADRTQAYKNDELGGAALNLNGVLGYLFRFALYPLLAIYFIKKSQKRRNRNERVEIAKEEYMSMWNIYITFMTLLITIFHRYNNYFASFTFLMIADWAFSPIIIRRKAIQLKYYIWVAIFVPLFYLQIYSTFYGALNRSGTITQGMIYAPYSSRFNPELDRDREKAFRFINPWRRF